MAFSRVSITDYIAKYSDKFMTNDKAMTRKKASKTLIIVKFDGRMSFRLPPSPQGKMASKYVLRPFFLNRTSKMTNL